MNNTDTEARTTYEIQIKWSFADRWRHLQDVETESETIETLDLWRKQYSSTTFRVIKKEVLDW